MNELILLQSIKKLSTAELKTSVVLGGKSITWIKLYDCKNKVSSWAEFESIKKFTWKSPQIIKSTFGFYKYFKIRSSCTANSPEFPLGDLYMHNNIIVWFPMLIWAAHTSVTFSIQYCDKSNHIAFQVWVNVHAFSPDKYNLSNITTAPNTMDQRNSYCKTSDICLTSLSVFPSGSKTTDYLKSAMSGPQELTRNGSHSRPQIIITAAQVNRHLSSVMTQPPFLDLGILNFNQCLNTRKLYRRM